MEDPKCNSFSYGKNKRAYNNDLADCLINVSGQKETGVDLNFDTYISKQLLGKYTNQFNKLFCSNFS